MALFPDLGSWLLRSVRRDNFTDNPILAVEKLNALPSPLQDADKEVLIGAVLTISSSLHLALGILQDILPQEKSQERLGEVLCPTLSHLDASLRGTLSAFDWRGSQHTTQAPTPRSATTPEPESEPTAGIPTNTSHQAQRLPPEDEPGPAEPLTPRPASSYAGSSQHTSTEEFPPLHPYSLPIHQLHVEDVQPRPELQLVKALQAEMRVQAAIHVAIESLEFAETQLKVVKEVNQLHGGAEELAMVAEDSESGYQDETSEIASSASELSDYDSGSESHYMGKGFEVEQYSINGESAAEESAVDSDNDVRYGGKKLDPRGFLAYQAARPKSQLPSLQQWHS
ncbi:hypothetical protein N0V88_007869 [Collariella sp. IMI 366227]|nr:hypothetical protein N0V88_007869 [Collariella sp. IMI 366227]